MTPFISLAKELDQHPESVPDDFQSLVIHIVGNQENGSFDAQMANALFQLQQIIYRLVAKTLYGEDATVSSLSDEELELFKLKFKVSAGSTNIETGLWEKVVSLVDKVVADMSPTQKLILAAFISGTFLGIYAIHEYSEYMETLQKSEEHVLVEQEETKRIELLIGRTSDAADESANVVVKAAKGAQSLTFGHREFDSESIKAAQRRAPRSFLGWEILEGIFVINSLDCTKSGTFSFVAVDLKTRKQIKAYYPIEDDDETAQDVRFVLADSLATGKAVLLHLNVGKKDGEVNKVILLDCSEAKN